MPEATLEQSGVTDTRRKQRKCMSCKIAINQRKPAADWLNRVIGSMKDEPAFDEVLAHGRAIREADRPAGDQSP